eukprot:TRINITY_DN3950_c0_g1_i1.p1 TRINITY_DN3950_c0_g1~~TRINITY_DN3950_c0_g1_i1.p1  ORF type:complete len:136 (+),score=28.91 TRINITY_DN3950_c0_g1_i1:298-705(+)
MVRLTRALLSEVFETTKTITSSAVHSFASLSDDFNPVHFPSEKSPGIVHGVYLLGLVSGLVGKEFPGSVLVQMESKFSRPCSVGTSVKVKVEKMDDRRLSSLAFVVVNENKSEEVFLMGNLKITRPPSIRTLKHT